MRLSDLPRPFIVAVCTDGNVASARATIQAATDRGAHAIELNLPAIGDVSQHALREVVDAAPLPVYTSCRRAAFMTVYGFDERALPAWSEEERMERQLAALACGAVAIDMEMDTFDPQPAPPLGTAAAASFAALAGPPAELTQDDRAIRRQRQIIVETHRAGGEVVLSCHTGRPQSADALIAIGHEAQRRGADLCKIVMPCRHRSDVQQLVAATAVLAAEDVMPFVMIGAGPHGQITRLIGPFIGSSWFIAQVERKVGGFLEQPTIDEVTAIVRMLSPRE